MIVLSLTLIIAKSIGSDYAVGTTNYYDIQDTKLNLYILTLTLLSKFISDDIILRLFPLIISISIAFILFKIMNHIDKEKALGVTAFLVISPIFAHMALILSSYTLSLLIILLGIYFVFIKKNNYGYLFFSLIIFFPIINILMLFIIFIYFFSINKAKKNDIINSTLIILGAIFFHSYKYLTFGILKIYPKINYSFISDFGANTGFSVFALLLALYYLFIKSDKIKTFNFLLLFMLSLIFGNDINFFTNIIIVLFATYSFYELLDFKWNLDFIKTLTLVAIICGLFLSLVSFTSSIETPSKQLVESLKWLQSNSNNNSTILSSIDNGFWIKYFAKRDVVLNKYYINDYFIKSNITSNLFQTRNLKSAKEYLNNLNINYILIDKKMRSTIWKKNDQGLLFLLRNKETFSKKFQNNYIQIWEIK